MGSEVVAAALVGLLLGALVVWLAVRTRAAQARAEEVVRSAAAVAGLEERVVARVQELEGLRKRLDEAGREVELLRQRVSNESERRAAAEERAQRLAAVEAELGVAHASNATLQAQLAELVARGETERAAAAEQRALLAEARAKLADAFKALSAEALQANNQQFLDLAKAALGSFQAEARGELEGRQQAIEALVAPIRESLGRVDEQIQAMEQARQHAYGALGAQVQALSAGQERLQHETASLVKALRAPTVRGRWGEIQLRRVVEIAGMLPYCDFVEQETVGSGEARLRPDLVVRLAGGKVVVVDAKAPLKAYLDAFEATSEEERRQHLKDHARLVRDHMSKLSAKAYWEQFSDSPEFVVMFLPGETFFSGALEHDPGLMEEGVAQRVLPASPLTLVALLRAVAYGWRQETIAASARQVAALGQELYGRLCVLAEHFERLGRSLGRATEAYNQAVGSLETRVLVQARRFPELGAGGAPEALPTLSQVEVVPRSLQATDWERQGAVDVEEGTGES
ncbi:MAG: DNA recombination protein RmuC [Thermoanaerobaculaceae bacterium]|nr:DNA recombination protein RmuC [Thermoanaerobaculaceae bacterium]MDI9622718.1 DNA recombination protein RmuC [Acidobacteriota bacterium]NLH10039.1 DNA recombination protein RmuC [Holophagae bacterium]HPW56061.1 DNA recombination protein RmuC [Thermoanaerobaculaceae bacterium]